VTAAARLWSVKDLAAYLDVPVQTIYQWRKRGYGPPGRRMGKHVRFRPADVERWIDSLGDRVA
jgi:excisionase family DNA binding protein